MTTPDHDFLGWSTDSSLPPVWETPVEWVQPSPPEWSVPPNEAPSPPQQALTPERPRRTWTSPPQPTHRSVGAQPAGAPPPSPNLAAATRSESSRGSRRPSASTAGLAGAAVVSVILAVLMIARVISSGGFRNGLLALVLSIVAVALVAATVLRARNVP